MAEKKRFVGPMINHCLFQGEIMEDPVMNDGYAFLNLRTRFTSRSANNQYIDTELTVPLMVEPDGPVRVIEQGHIKKFRQLAAWCYYKSWQTPDGQLEHRFVVKKFDLGHKPFEPAGDGGGGAPPLPQ